ncbi:MAG: peptidylprolyl isomerase [Desulfuromonadaceae bacterium]|jgi:hypothetical protein
MRHYISVLMLQIFLLSLLVTPAFSWWWDDPLITIDGVRYSTDDFKQWWKYWNDQDLELPETVDPYLDWLLLVREGQRMELEQVPSFQHKSRVFLQVRSLLLLKKEEINDRIRIDERELWDRYKELYTPIWLMQRLEFLDETAANAAREKLASGELTDEALIQLPPEEGGPVSTREDWRRPSSIDPGWADLFRPLAVGETTAPQSFDDHSIVYRVKERLEGDEEDFAKLRGRLKDDTWKEQEERLTEAMLERLMEKYEVKINRERLELLPVIAPDEVYSDEPIVTTNRQNVSEKDFIVLLRRGVGPRLAHNPGIEEMNEIKENVLKGILNQNLTNWESLDRNYQEREPFKAEYEFNVNHRLTLALAERFFSSENEVSPDEIEAYYQANINRYSQPELARFHILEDEEGSVDRIWSDVVVGMEFTDAVKKETKKNISVTDIPFSHLDDAVQQVVKGLAKGETSEPFVSNDTRFILHLVEHLPAKPIPLAKVEASIRAKLEQERRLQKRNDYLDQLKSRSKIEISASAWRKVKQELGEAK